jgi:hypothetical protein
LPQGDVRDIAGDLHPERVDDDVLLPEWGANSLCLNKEEEEEEEDDDEDVSTPSLSLCRLSHIMFLHLWEESPLQSIPKDWQISNLWNPLDIPFQSQKSSMDDVQLMLMKIIMVTMMMMMIIMMMIRFLLTLGFWNGFVWVPRSGPESPKRFRLLGSTETPPHRALKIFLMMMMCDGGGGGGGDDDDDDDDDDDNVNDDDKDDDDNDSDRR